MKRNNHWLSAAFMLLALFPILLGVIYAIGKVLAAVVAVAEKCT